MTAYADLRADLSSIVSAAGYTTMTTVDTRNRPRSRMLIAVWELDGDSPLGWLGTYRSPVKDAHIRHNPHVAFAYWTRREDAAYLDTVAEWVDDAATVARVWDLYRTGSPRGVGYNPQQFWTGPQDPEFCVLRLDPWRVQVHRMAELAAGRPSRIWRADRDA